ncbi:MAG TPA: dihydrofolate reductase [Bacteroidota bacterium]
MKLAIIAAVARNRVIGRDGKIPWHISDDLKRFKRLTVGHPVLMGRRTWESLGRPLADRRNVVLSSREIPGVETYPTAERALEALAGEERVFVIGGAALYARFLDRADELYLTLVDQEPGGDTLFPPYEELLKARYRLTRREDHPGYHFADYIKAEG